MALARSIFRKGADFTSAIAFEFASTNLVIGLGIIMLIMLGWQFAVAEYVGGTLMILLLWLLFRLFLSRRLVDVAKRQADRGLVGSMEDHAEMDRAVTEKGRWSSAQPRPRASQRSATTSSWTGPPYGRI